MLHSEARASTSQIAPACSKTVLGGIVLAMSLSTAARAAASPPASSTGCCVGLAAVEQAQRRALGFAAAGWRCPFWAAGAASVPASAGALGGDARHAIHDASSRSICLSG